MSYLTRAQLKQQLDQHEGDNIICLINIVLEGTNELSKDGFN